jgi:serine/threonine protein kinase
MFVHNYQVEDKIGCGAFSTVFKGKHRFNMKAVAIKISTEKQTHEAKILAYLNRSALANVPTMFWYGRFGDNTCIATTFYSKTFEQFIVVDVDQNFVKILGICEQLITIMEQIHGAYIIHSDVKPDNFMVDENQKIVLIDFGLSSLFYNVEMGIVRQNKMSEHLIGSCKFASFNLHLGNSVACRDDLISVGYVMMTVFGVELPWSKRSTNEEVEPLSNALPLSNDLPLYHVGHPANIERAKYKRHAALNAYLLNLIDQKHKASHYILHYLIPYFQKTYNLAYGDKVEYKVYREMFATLF